MAKHLAMALVAAVLALAGAGAAGAQTAPLDTSHAVMAAMEQVCRPSTEENVRPDASATRLRYPSVAVPPNLPTGRPLHAWKAPSPGPGSIFLLDGGLPDSAQAGCIFAVYGEALPTLPGIVQTTLAEAHAGFEPNPTLSISNLRQTVVRFDRRRGDVITSIIVIQPKGGAADAPTALVVVSRVDYGWLSKFGG